MKKKIYIVLPSILILLITLLSRTNKNILTGLFLFFPVIFITQGILYSDLKKELLLGFSLSSIAFIIPINLLYNMGNCIDLLVTYILLGLISYFMKKIIIYIKTNNKSK